MSDLVPGVHVITEQDLDDPDDIKGQRILRESRAAVAAAADVDDLVGRLRQILRSHERLMGRLRRASTARSTGRCRAPPSL